MIIHIYLLISFVLNILCEYSSSKKLLDSNLESSTGVSRVIRHSPNNQPADHTGSGSVRGGGSTGGRLLLLLAVTWYMTAFTLPHALHGLPALLPLSAPIFASPPRRRPVEIVAASVRYHSAAAVDWPGICVCWKVVAVNSSDWISQ